MNIQLREQIVTKLNEEGIKIKGYPNYKGRVSGLKLDFPVIWAIPNKANLPDFTFTTSWHLLSRLMTGNIDSIVI